MNRPSLVVGLAATFAGLTVLLTTLGVVFNLGLLLLAVPFGAATYLLWYHASGRLEARTRRRVYTAGDGRSRERADRRAWTRETGSGARADGSGASVGGFGAGPRERRRGTDANARGDANGRRRRGRTGGSKRTGPSADVAHEVLGTEPGVEPAAIRRAYRERAKETHPDTEDGDEEAFKRVTEAYERLADGTRTGSR